MNVKKKIALGFIAFSGVVILSMVWLGCLTRDPRMHDAAIGTGFFFGIVAMFAAMLINFEDW